MKVRITITAADIDGEMVEADDPHTFIAEVGEKSEDHQAQSHGKAWWAGLYRELPNNVYYHVHYIEEPTE